MLITNHVLSGALVGRLARRPGRALAWGLASHVALDLTPHWGYSVAGHRPAEPGEPLPREAMPMAYADGLVGLAAVAATAVWAWQGRRTLPVLAGVVGACLLDLDKPSVHFFGASPYPWLVDSLHARMQVGREAPHRLPQEAATAVVLAAVASRVLPLR